MTKPEWLTAQGLPWIVGAVNFRPTAMELADTLERMSTQLESAQGQAAGMLKEAAEGLRKEQRVRSGTSHRMDLARQAIAGRYDSHIITEQEMRAAAILVRRYERAI